MDAQKLLDDVTGRVRAALDEAEETAREIVANAEDRAKELIANAEAEATKIRERAETEAHERLAQVREALVSLEGSIGGSPSSEIDPGPAEVPEPMPPIEPEPSPPTEPSRSLLPSPSRCRPIPRSSRPRQPSLTAVRQLAKSAGSDRSPASPNELFERSLARRDRCPHRRDEDGPGRFVTQGDRGASGIELRDRELGLPPRRRDEARQALARRPDAKRQPRRPEADSSSTNVRHVGL